jgi:putative phosphoribosyl transferase
LLFAGHSFPFLFFCSGPDCLGNVVATLFTSTSVIAGLALKRGNPAHLVVAVPVAASETCEELKNEVDEIVYATTPEPFYAVGLLGDFPRRRAFLARSIISFSGMSHLPPYSLNDTEQ